METGGQPAVPATHCFTFVFKTKVHVLLFPKKSYFLFHICQKTKIKSCHSAQAWPLTPGAAPTLLALPGAHLFLIHSGAAAERPGTGGAAAGEGWAVC